MWEAALSEAGQTVRYAIGSGQRTACLCVIIAAMLIAVISVLLLL